jgi:hypothetical protein
VLFLSYQKWSKEVRKAASVAARSQPVAVQPVLQRYRVLKSHYQQAEKIRPITPSAGGDHTKDISKGYWAQPSTPVNLLSVGKRAGMHLRGKQWRA